MALATSFETALQTRILAVLGEVLEAEGVPVWGDAPANAPTPFVRVNRVVGRTMDTLTRPQREIFAYLSAHSSVKGNDEVNDIVEAMRQALHNQEAALNVGMEAGTIILAQVTAAESRTDDDEVSYVGDVTLRAIVQGDAPS